MRTSADEVSIHALSPESTFAASSARASEASASTAASASDERTHQYPAPKDRCLLSIVPPEVEEIDEQRWCHDPPQGVNREPPGASAEPRAPLPSFRAQPTFCAAPGEARCPHSRRKLSRRRSAMKAVMTRNAG